LTRRRLSSLNTGMNTNPAKTGRPRRYDLNPPQGFTNREIGLGAALLQELAERVYDQMGDLPQEALDYAPGNSRLSIGWLVLHMAWAEARWVGLATGAKPDPALAARLEPGGLEHYGQTASPHGDATSLIAVCRKVQGEFTAPALAPVGGLDDEMERGGLTVTLRGVLQQLTWHWTYHSGQIGLIRLLWGSDYQWTMESMRAPTPDREAGR
jgi:uncharacterized damage-inducible protein DinB